MALRQASGRLPGCFGLAIAEAILIAHCRCFRGR